MANSLCFSSVCSFNTPNKPGIVIDNSFTRKVLRVNEVFQSSRSARIQSLEAKAADKSPRTKPNSIVCADCDGNGEEGRFYVEIVMELGLLVDL
ncbi:hypothetical protein PTKIN_Ptkin19aG0045800 [Pterospermum kingtungense]